MNYLRFLVLGAAALFLASTATAQRTTGEDARTNVAADLMQPELPPVQPAEGVEGVLDPDLYVVGPGDVFRISVRTSPPTITSATVSAEGLLVAPMVGALPVSGQKLRAVREMLGRRIGQQYRLAEADVVLVRPRRIRVRLEGGGVHAGKYDISAASRTSTILADPFVRRQVSPVPAGTDPRMADLVPIAERNILVRRANGQRITVDLVRYAATGTGEANPYLVEGDEIVVNELDGSYPTIAAGGSVWLPRIFEFRTGDRLADLVGFARGVRPDGNADSVLFTRGSGPTRVVRLSGPDSGMALMPGDRIWVPARSEAPRAEMVTLSGEVVHPGAYPVPPGGERLSAVLRMAGGLTEKALTNGATITRSTMSPADRRSELTRAFRGNAAVEDTQYVRQELEIRAMGEVVSADFAAALTDPGGAADPVVLGGDRIYVPARTGTVYVFGQVSRPGQVPFRPGADVSAYVRAAGGLTDRAKSGDMMVIKRATRQWLAPHETSVEDGDAVWVPKEIERGFTYDIQVYASIAGIVSSLVTIIFVASQIK